jgi:hypothetical protein
LCHANAQPTASTNSPQSSSTMGLSSSNCTYLRVDLSDPKKLQHTLPPQHLGRPLILATLRGGLASPTASLSAKDSRNNRREGSISSTLPSLRSSPHQAQQRKSSNTHGPSAPRQQHEPTSFQQHHRPAPPSPLATGLQPRRLQEGYDARRRHRTSRRTRFSPLEPPATRR